MPLHEVHLGTHPLERYANIVNPETMSKASRLAAQLRKRLAGRVVWNVSSTAAGGGVAEILAALIPYGRGAALDVRWLVIQGDPEFFRVTKRLHHALHGSQGDGSPLDTRARALYERTSRRNAIEVAGVVRPGDVVIAHDPQTAGLIPYLVRHGALVIWRCHVGHDRPSEQAQLGWDFLCPYLRDAQGFVFSHETYAPSFLDPGRTFIVHPTIDPFSPKNEPLPAESIRSILVGVGIVEGPAGGAGSVFVREDGSPGRVDRGADVVRLGRPPRWDTPLVVQVSRWDRLKDPVGVLHTFARLLVPDAPGGAELVIAGPNVHAIADDPEAGQVLDEVITAWRALPHGQRRRVHLASLPMNDLEENAIIVNALQRHAAVVVQKSVREGFGLTVTEAMWKARPIVASAVAGIREQIRDGIDGLLVDPSEHDMVARSIERLLVDRELALRLGESARERVRERFLGMHALLEYAEIIEHTDDRVDLGRGADVTP